MHAYLPAHGALIRLLDAQTLVTEQMRAAIVMLPFQIRELQARSEIVARGEPVSNCVLVVEGMACRSKMVNDAARQILSLHPAGDLPDLEGLEMGRLDHTIEALSACVIALIPHDAMRAAMAMSPDLNRALRRYLHIEASIYREWIANVGQREAPMRIGHIFCESFARLNALGLVEPDDIITLPMTQADLADASGLSTVHVNRVLQTLRARELIATDRQSHKILNWPELRRASDFNADYLHLRRTQLTPSSTP